MWKIHNISVEKGRKNKDYLVFPTISEQIPAFMIHGNEPGPTVLIMAGIHGCEYTSIDAALTLGNELSPESIKGRVLVIPIANIASFYSRSIYVHPADGKNLNRVFPGKEDGTESERLAFWIHQEVFSHVDFVIDLHGGDMIEALVPFTIYQKSENPELMERAKEIASLFHIDYVVGSEGQVKGSTYGSVSDLDKIGVIAEAGQQGILDPDSSRLLSDGTKNVLKAIGSLDGEPSRDPVKHLETFEWYSASVTGLWYPEIAIGESVVKGQILGSIKDEFGQKVVDVVANVSGVILFLVTSLAVKENDALLAIGD